jgi:hypothetical protein
MEETHWEGQNFSEVVAPQEEEDDDDESELYWLQLVRVHKGKELVNKTGTESTI